MPANPPQARVAGVLRPVCCPGCKAAAEWIDQLGLANYYRLRSEPAERAPDAEERRRNAEAWRRPELTRHVVRDAGDGQREAALLVDGVRCSACVWLIERAVGSVPGVSSVQVNAGARRARLVWDEAVCDLPRIVEAFAKAGYRALPLDAAALDDAKRREARTALKRLLVAGFGAMQAMMYAVVLYLGGFGDDDAVTRDLFRWFGMLVATPVVTYAAQPFFAGAVRTLRARRLGMDVPVALAIALIYSASFVEILRGGAEVYFESVSMFVFFLLLGRFLEMRARHRAGDLSDALARLVPQFAERYREDGTLERVGALELEVGDWVHVTTGSSVPADGVLVGDECRVDEALLSGESVPVVRARGDELVAGSVIVDGAAELEVRRVGADTMLAGIVAMVTRAQTERPRLARAGERAASRFVARVLTLAVLTAVGWLIFDPGRALTATLAVLVVSCPCAFALAVPAAFTRALAVLAGHGVLVVRSDAIEELAGATHVVFDKTGTLTEPVLALEATELLDARLAASGAHALALARALARGNRHPVALALGQAEGEDSGLRATGLRVQAGGGIEGSIDGRSYRLGHSGFVLDEQARDPALEDAVILASQGQPIAAFHLGERLRVDAAETLDALRDDGLTIEIVSGDAASKVAAVAARLKVQRWHARQQPGDKLERLRALRAEGARVIAVGDGINDAPVLAGADVAVALASGTELAQAASDVVLANQQLATLPLARRIARETMVVLRQNQRWALWYNLSVVPLGALGFIPPWLAALGMSASSLVVVLNALRVGRRLDISLLHPPPAPQESLA